MDCGQESYLVQLDFSAAFDRVSHDGLIFKLRSAGVGGCLLFICRGESLTDRRQRAVVDVASSEWIPIVSGVPRGSVLGSLLFILYTSEMFDLVENRFFAYANSTLLAVIRRPSERPAVAASVNRDLARIHEWWSLVYVAEPKEEQSLGGQQIQDCLPSPW